MATISVSVPDAVAEALGPLGEIPGACRRNFDDLLRDPVFDVGDAIVEIAEDAEPMDVDKLKGLAQRLIQLASGLDGFPDPNFSERWKRIEDAEREAGCPVCIKCLAPNPEPATEGERVCDRCRLEEMEKFAGWADSARADAKKRAASLRKKAAALRARIEAAEAD